MVIDTARSLPRGSETILLVDDLDILIELTQAFLKVQGYTIFTALNGVEALQVLETNSSQIDLLFTDVVMPLMGGPELAQQVKRLYPKIKVLFASGYVGDVLKEYGLTSELGRLIPKPYNLASLSSSIREILDVSQASPGPDAAFLPA